MNTKHIATILSLTAAAAVFPTTVFADGCTTQYGTTQYGSGDCTNATITINKDVYDPKSGTYVANLGSNQPFAVSNEVLFKLTVTNTGTQPITAVSVTDILPPHLSFESGPGSYNAATKTLSFTIDSLAAGASHDEYVLAKVDNDTTTPSIYCVTNKATASENGMTVSDTAQMCVQVKETNVTTLPVAGAESLALVIPFLGLAGAGMALIGKKK